jgi:polyisoprenoid-binding protein YceI
MKTRLVVAYLSLGLAGAAGARAEPADYTLDPEHVTVGFLVAHIGYAKVLGQFLEVQGAYRFDEATGELSNVSVVVDTGSVFTNHDERDDHLRSDEFLDARAHPQMRFTADAARRTGDRAFEIDGRLELLGESQPLTLTATWNKSEEYPFGGAPYVMGVSARGTFRRSAYGMDYAVDNGWVGNEVEIIVEFEARRQ